MNVLEDHYEVQADLTKEFNDIFVEKFYETKEEICKLLKQYEQVTGTVFTCRRSRKRKIIEDGKAVEVECNYEVQCIHFGRNRSKAKVPLECQKRSMKLGCRVEVIFDGDGTGFIVKRGYFQHNHRVQKDLAQLYHGFPKLTGHVREAAKPNSVEVSGFEQNVTNLAGSDDSIVYNQEELLSFLHRNQASSMEPSDSGEVRTMLASLPADYPEEEDSDFEPYPPKEKIISIPIVNRNSTYGRVSKPPKRLIKYHKHMCLDDLTNLDDAEEKAISPLCVSDEETNKALDSAGSCPNFNNKGLSADEDLDITKSCPHECLICRKFFCSKTDLLQHNIIVHNPNGCAHGVPYSNPNLAAIRKRTKLKEALQNATPEDLIEFAAPRLASVMSVWEYLLMRSEAGDPPLPQMTKLVLEYIALVDKFREFMAQQVEPAAEDKTPLGCKKRRHQHVSEPKRIGQGSLEGKKMKQKILENETELALRLSTPISQLESYCSKETEEGNFIHVSSNEEATALALPLGRYQVKKPLCKAYLPRRYHLLAEAAPAVVTRTTKNKTIKNLPENVSVNLRSREIPRIEPSGFQEGQDRVSPPEGLQELVEEEPSLSTFIWGGTLFCLHNEGLGYEVPEDWITTGAFLPVLTDTGKSSDLVMERASGRLFYRPTGHLVTMVTDPPATAPQQQTEMSSTQPQEGYVDPATDSSVVDLNSLLPGVEISEVTPGICVVTKANGIQFRIEHGGKGITLETLQAILRVDVNK